MFKSYNALGLLAWNEGRLEDAIGLFENATASARANGDQSGLAKAANNIALVYTELGNFAKARKGFLDARRAGHELHDAKIEGRSLDNIGMLDIQMGDPRSAVAELVEARALLRSSGDVTGEQNVLGQLGSAYDALGEPRLAFAALDTALEFARSHGLKQEEASNLELIAGIERQAGELRRSLELYEKASALDKELGLGIEQGTDLRNVAQIYFALGRTDLAVSKVNTALVAHRAAHAPMQDVQRNEDERQTYRAGDDSTFKRFMAALIFATTSAPTRVICGWQHIGGSNGGRNLHRVIQDTARPAST